MHACLISHRQIIRISNLMLSILFVGFFFFYFLIPLFISYRSPWYERVCVCDSRIKQISSQHVILLSIVPFFYPFVSRIWTLESGRFGFFFSFSFFLVYYRRLLIQPMHHTHIRLANFIWFFPPFSPAPRSPFVERRVEEGESYWRVYEPEREKTTAIANGWMRRRTDA